MKQSCESSWQAGDYRVVAVPKRHGGWVHRAEGRTVAIAIAGLAFALSGLNASKAADPPGGSGNAFAAHEPLLKKFFAAKGEQARKLTAIEQEEFRRMHDGEERKIAPEIEPFFIAGAKGDWRTMTNLFQRMGQRSYQYGIGPVDEALALMAWQTVNEAYHAYVGLIEGGKYAARFAREVVESIPPGSIYFGGTDPGRFLITAFSTSHAGGDPFFTLTQNALADRLYLTYLQSMYGGKIYTPTDKDSARAFQEYLRDAGQRAGQGELKSGEGVAVTDNGVQVSGFVAVMQVNARIARIIFDENPGREFYLEQWFPSDWMYPHLVPHGWIMRIHREPLGSLPERELVKSREFWNHEIAAMIGGWLREDTGVAEICEFAERVHLKKDLRGFQGDPEFIRSEYACRAFSKLRSSMAGVYVWRLERARAAPEKSRLAREADLALKQAFAICPYSPDAARQFAEFLSQSNRRAEALQVAETALRLPLADDEERALLRDLLQQLKEGAGEAR